MFEHGEFDRSRRLRDSDGSAEIADCFRRVAAAADAAQSGHAGIVPAADALLLHQLQQLALAQQRVGQVEAIELNLLRRKDAQLLDKPVVERAMVLKLQRTHGVRNFFERVRLAVRVVVHGINAPLVAGAVMLGVQDAVHHGIAHVQVRRSHVDFRAQDARAVGEFSGLHALEQIEIFFHRAIAMRAVLAGLGERAAMFANFFGGEIVDIGLAVANQLEGPFVELIEVIRSVEKSIPVEAEPLHVGHDGIDVFGFFLLGIGVVETQVGMAGEFVGEAEVEADRFGVADVEIAVGLGRKAGLHAAVVLIGLEVVEKDVAYEVGWARLRGGVCARVGLGIGRFHRIDLTAKVKTAAPEAKLTRPSRLPLRGRDAPRQPAGCRRY